MQLQQIGILLPCHSLEDFPTYHQGDEADELLASWTALWHPRLIAFHRSAPKWYRVDYPPEDVAGFALLLPSACQQELSPDFREQAARQGAQIIAGETSRTAVVSKLLALVDTASDDAGIRHPNDNELARDFFALGFCFLQIQLLTRQMRYSSGLDEKQFDSLVSDAAAAAMNGDRKETSKRLQACFDMLAQERDQYYPVTVYLLDLSLTAKTLDPTLIQHELQRDSSSNFLMSGDVLTHLANEYPQVVTQLSQCLSDGRCGLIGGEQEELELPLLPCELIAQQLNRGKTVYEEHLGHRPTVFGRRRFGLTTALPQILAKFGYVGALHATLDDGRFPEGAQSKTSWEGDNQSALAAIVRAPLNADSSSTFLQLANHLSDSMDMDHVATRCFAHWAGTASPWYGDLRRASQFTEAMGRFVTIDDYFDQTDDMGAHEQFQSSEYRSPYLRQAFDTQTPNPISTWINFWRDCYHTQAARQLAVLKLLLGGARQPDSSRSEFASLKAQFFGSASQASSLTSQISNLKSEIADAIPRSPSATGGYLILNPCSFARRIMFEAANLDRLPPVSRPIYAADNVDRSTRIIVDVPPNGFAWVDASGTASPRTKRKTPAIAEDDCLRNEFLEAFIDRTTGSLKVLRNYQTRGNRLSQRLAYRFSKDPNVAGQPWRDADVDREYSVMVADETATTAADSTVGEITTHGRLVDKQGRDLANFSQVFRLERGSRVLQVTINLQPHELPGGEPWTSYFAARIAWADEAAELHRCINDSRQRITARRFESPLLIDIDDGARRTSVLTCGLPYHRRVGYRQLDMLLIVAGETTRDFRFGVGLDLKQPIREAISILTPATYMHDKGGMPVAGQSAWLLHVDARNVLTTGCEPIFDKHALVGLRIRLREVNGRSANPTVRCFRPFTQAHKSDFVGNRVGDCEVTDGEISVNMLGFEWAQIEAFWS